MKDAPLKTLNDDMEQVLRHLQLLGILRQGNVLEQVEHDMLTREMENRLRTLLSLDKRGVSKLTVLH